MFKALVVDNSSGVVVASVRDLDEASLPPGNVTVAVEYSGINYKDGLVATGAGGLVKGYPHVPGIDFAGSELASRDPADKPVDKGVLTAWPACCRSRNTQAPSPQSDWTVEASLSTRSFRSYCEA